MLSVSRYHLQLRNYDAQLEKERQDKAAQDQKHGTSKASTGLGAAKSAAGGAGAAPRAAIGPALPPHLQKVSVEEEGAPCAPVLTLPHVGSNTRPRPNP